MYLIALTQSTIVAFALISLAVCIPAGSDSAATAWSPGRASFYPGLKEEAYTQVDLLKLTCRTRKPILPGSDFPVDQSAGAFGALSDHSPLWNAPKCRDNPGGNPICDTQATCGLCVEIKCKGYWESPANHPNTCNPKNSVVIKILDACPGNHPINKAKKNNPCNQTDIDHFDLYQPAFAHIAQPRDGVISMEYQTTSCDRVGYYVNGQRSSPPFTALPTKS
ncbi:RlpA-like double-psi beta-barrel-protein domain-containing protein-containing protein [Paraphysoderma sedebokerense]|nr:RlpA-like double-psi beta-barrel-protein domain-containing protein-containing protein [Paraphysoderma sedebokerense]